MKNTNTMRLKLTRHEVCDIRMALLSVAQSFKEEATEAEKASNIEVVERATRSAKKWYALRDKIIEQFDAQDKEDAK